MFSVLPGKSFHSSQMLLHSEVYTYLCTHCSCTWLSLCHVQLAARQKLSFHSGEYALWGIHLCVHTQAHVCTLYCHLACIMQPCKQGSLGAASVWRWQYVCMCWTLCMLGMTALPHALKCEKVVWLPRCSQFITNVWHAQSAFPYLIFFSLVFPSICSGCYNVWQGISYSDKPVWAPAV